MSASELRAKQPLRNNRHPTGTLRIALVSSEPLFREGMRLAFRKAQSLALLGGTTLADAVQLGSLDS